MLIHNILSEFYLELHVDWGEMIFLTGKQIEDESPKEWSNSLNRN